VARSAAWPTRMGRMRVRIACWWTSRGPQRGTTTLRGHRVRPRVESPGRCEPPWLDCDVRLRPQRGRNLQ
jgi:hypothetical protein